MNTPGHSPRVGERAPAIFATGPARPRRLGHVLYGTPDIQASQRFLVDVIGLRLTDSSPGIISFLRCSSDHHNVALMNAPVGFFHHSSWQVNDVDEIGKGAQNLLAVDPARSVWGLGRHFLGSNLFWYFRDPAGNFAEYYSDLDQIVDDDAWVAREWEPDKSLYAWGPPVPLDFVSPPDLAELAAAR
jgi:catechol 2,3-dioxygenase-like lactoylglutathione lyase family enzyme